MAGPEGEAGDTSTQEMEDKGRRYLIFVIDDLKLGVDAEFVVEILSSHTATALPLVPSYVCGIFNMRGQIIPVLNIRRRLGKSDNEGENLLIVLNYDNMQIGVLVDAVDQMVEIDDESILPMPAQSMQRFVSGMCTIPDRLRHHAGAGIADSFCRTSEAAYDRTEQE